ncbi:hypothetical protein HJFPF1_05857 [Paramyrothecium foliicola]|nr:hypothetical protein HJFPF1_05857 [Paramyrothecium foliicola]
MVVESATTFETWSEAFHEAVAGAKSDGYDLAVEDQVPSATTPRRVILAFLRLRLPTKKWCIQISGVESSGSHDHQLHEHNFLIQLKTAENDVWQHKAQIIKLWNSGVDVPNILEGLYGWACIDKGLYMDPQAGMHNDLCTDDDIKDLLKYHCEEELAGESHLQWLLGRVKKEHRKDGETIGLLLAPRSGIEILVQNPDMLLMDMPSKHTRFGVPVLQICGASVMGKLFHVAFVFLRKGLDIQRQYAWALQALFKTMSTSAVALPRVIVTGCRPPLKAALQENPDLRDLPHIFCRKQLESTVKSACKGYFDRAWKQTFARSGTGQKPPNIADFMSSWADLVRSHTREELDANMKYICNKAWFSPGAMQYILDRWISPWQNSILRYHVNQNRHFGHITAPLPDFVRDSNGRALLFSDKGDSESIYERLEAFLRQQNNNYGIKSITLSRAQHASR